MFSKRCFVILFVLFFNSNRIHSNVLKQKFEICSKLIADIIVNEQVASVLWIKSCWSKTDKLNFVKNTSIPIQIAEPIALTDFNVDENINKQWMFVDMNCEGSSDFLLNVNVKLFGHPFRWIIADATMDVIQNLPFLPGSNIVLANKNENTNKYTLRQGNV